MMYIRSVAFLFAQLACVLNVAVDSRVTANKMRLERTTGRAVAAVRSWSDVSEDELANHDFDHTPAAWGPYRVSTAHGDAAGDRILVVDSANRPVKEIDCGTFSSIYEMKLTPFRNPVMVVVAWDGSNIYCGHQTFVFSRDEGVRNVAIISGGEGTFRTSGRGAIQFVMHDTGVLEYACDLCHACEPNLPLVLDWNGGRLRNVTARYPSLSINAASSYRQEFLDIRANWNNSSAEDAIIAPAAGYFANEYELGRGARAYRWILARLPNRDTRAWFRKCAKVCRYQIAQIKRIEIVNQARVLHAGDGNPFSHPSPSLENTM